MNTIKIEMPLEWWSIICKKCKELTLDHEKYIEVKNYGKLFFDLQRHQINKNFPIPDPKDYMKY